VFASFAQNRLTSQKPFRRTQLLTRTVGSLQFLQLRLPPSGSLATILHLPVVESLSAPIATAKAAAVYKGRPASIDAARMRDLKA
jgi:hypothetical protein